MRGYSSGCLFFHFDAEAGIAYRLLDFLGPHGCGYRVGTDGSVWSRRKPGGRTRDRQWHRLKNVRDSRGYSVVDLGSGPRCQHNVHHLVLKAFVGPCPPGMECRHFPDRDQANERVENLRWGTPRENVADAMLHGTRLIGERVPNAKLTEDDVMGMHRLAGQGAYTRTIPK
jgi:hypothetical protein